MTNWTTEKQPFGANHVPLIAGLASDGSNVAVPIAVDPVTGRVLVNATGGGGGSTTSANVYTGQQTAGTAATALTGTSTALVNGIIVKALTTNTATLYVGAAGVSSSTGFPLSPGESTSIAVSNLNLVYVIGNNTDKVSWIGN